MHFSKVDLPDPFWPMTPNTSPSRTVKETSFTAVNSAKRLRPRAAMSSFSELVFSLCRRKFFVRCETSRAMPDMVTSPQRTSATVC